MGALYETDDESDDLPAWLGSAVSGGLARDAGLAPRLIEAPTAGAVRAPSAPQVAATGYTAGGSAGGEGGTAPSSQPAYDGTIAAVAATGNARIDGILSGVRWNQSQITYSFPANSTDYEANYPGNNPNEGFGQLTIAQQAVYHNALNSSNATTGPGGAIFTSVEGFTNQDILFLLPTPNATMRAAYSTDPGSTAYAYYPGTGFNDGDAWYGTNSPRNYQAPVLGGDAYRSTFHEIGHQLGLKHGHETGGPGNTALPAEYNSHEYSVMTYASYIGHPGNIGYTNETYGHPQSWMMLDIAALQYMYGADFGHNGGNTSYTWSTTTGEMFVNGVGQGTPGANRIFLTIWDGNGIDTYNLGNYTSDLVIDLTPGGYSDFNSGQSAYLGGGPNNGYARGNVFNALQYQGDARSLIENVVGGSGNDNITGNAADNAFTANDGNDSLYGLDGNDNLAGNGGNDYLKGGGGTDYLSGGNDNDELKGGGEADTLIGGLGIDTASYDDSGAAVDVTLDGGGIGGTAQGDTLSEIENLYGSGYNDTLRGNGQANDLNGSGGVDTMIGFGGNDTYHVDEAGDIVLETSGNDTVLTSVSYTLADGLSVETLTLTPGTGTDPLNLTGNELAQRLNGNAGNNRLDGGAGADTLRGFGGNDIYYVDNAGDVILEVAGGGNDEVASRISYTLAAGVSAEILRTTTIAGTANIDLTGNEIAQALFGNAGNNRLDGGAGVDSLRGFGGNDTYYVDNAGDLIFEAAGDGTDAVAARASYTLGAGVSVETLRAVSSAATTAIDLTGNEIAQTVSGNAGANRLDGGAGADTLYGFGGNDTYYIDNGGDQVFEVGGQGTDAVATRVSYTLAAGQSVEALRTTTALGTSNLSLVGNELGQSVTGNAGNNLIDGGRGNDTLRGNDGTDTFRFATTLGASNVDHIVDFVVVDDTIRLDQTIFTQVNIGNLGAAAFKDIGVAGATVDGSDRIIYDRTTGQLFYDADGSGATARVQFAVLDNKPTTLSNADFFVVA